MPKPIFHLWIADQLAAEFPTLRTPDFYLGHIAPDAALSRANPPAGFKNLTHLAKSPSDKVTWFNDTLDYYCTLPEPTLFDLGYCMHILTDIQFRRYMRSYYDQYQIPENERDAYDQWLMPLIFNQLFDTREAYLRCVEFAAASTLKTFPFTLTRQEMDDNLAYARKNAPVLEEPPRPAASSALPIPDARQLGRDICRAAAKSSLMTSLKSKALLFKNPIHFL